MKNITYTNYENPVAFLDFAKETLKQFFSQEEDNDNTLLFLLKNNLNFNFDEFKIQISNFEIEENSLSDSLLINLNQKIKAEQTATFGSGITFNILYQDKVINNFNLPFVSFPQMVSSSVFLINGLKKVFVPTLSKKFGLRINEGDNDSSMQIVPKYGSRINIKYNPFDHNLIISFYKHSMYWFIFVALIDENLNLHDIFSKLFPVKETTVELNSNFMSNINNLPICFDILATSFPNTNTFSEARMLLAQELKNNNQTTVKVYDIPTNQLKYFSYNTISTKLFKNNEMVEDLNLLFNNETLYDLINNKKHFLLGIHARKQLNECFGIDANVETITSDDIINSIKILIAKNTDTFYGKVHTILQDDTSVANRYLFSIGDLFVKNIQKILSEVSNNIKLKLVNLSRNTSITNLTTAEEISDMLQGIIRENINFQLLSFKFMYELNANSSIQFLDQVNLVAEILHTSKITYLSTEGISQEQATTNLRNIRPSLFGRICCLATPEGPHSGLVVYATHTAFVDKFGNLLSSYNEVNEGKIDVSKKVFLSSFVESLNEYCISEYQAKDQITNLLKEDILTCKSGNNILSVSKNEINLIEISPTQIFSFAVLLIPFLNHNDANRTTTAANMQKQSISIIYPEYRKVRSGIENQILSFSNYKLYSPVSGKVIFADNYSIQIEDNNNKVFNLVLEYLLTNQNSFIFQKTIVKPGQIITKGDLIITSSEDIEGDWCNGVNLRVAIMPFKGLNFEDSVVISDRCVKDQLLTSVTTKIFEISLLKTKIGSEFSTKQGVNISDTNLDKLDDSGIIKLNSHVYPHTVLVAKFVPRMNSLLGKITDKGLKKFFGNTLFDHKEDFLLSNMAGIVTDIQIIDAPGNDVIKKIVISISKLSDIEAGDKITGRYGNKMVVSAVLREDQMPYDEFGNRMDMIINPLGIPSRMNVGQIGECYASQLLEVLPQEHFTADLYSDFDLTALQQKMKENNLPIDGKYVLYNPDNCKPYGKKIVLGYMYINKLVHMVNEKIHYRSLGQRNSITLQPVGGKSNNGAQRFGEMENWGAESFGAADTILEKTQILSDNSVMKNKLLNSIIYNNGFFVGFDEKSFEVSDSFNLFLNYMKALNVKITLDYENNAENVKHDEFFSDVEEE